MKTPLGNSAGMTLPELIMGTGLSAVLAAAVFTYFQLTAKMYRASQTEQQVHREVTRTLDEIAQAVRSATAVNTGPACPSTTTTSVDVTTPAGRYVFSRDGDGVLWETIDTAAATRLFDDAQMFAGALTFSPLCDGSVRRGVQVTLQVTHPLLPADALGNHRTTVSAAAYLRNGLISQL